MAGVRRPECKLLEADGARKLGARLVPWPKIEVQPDERVITILQEAIKVNWSHTGRGACRCCHGHLHVHVKWDSAGDHMSQEGMKAPD